MSKAFETRVVDHGSGVIVVHVLGPLLPDGSTALLRTLNDLPRGHKHLVINLSQVTFISSSGIGALMAIAEQYREEGRADVRLAALSPAVTSVIDLLDLHELISIDETEEQSLRRAKAA